jgi:hypothetical protein
MTTQERVAQLEKIQGNYESALATKIVKYNTLVERLRDLPANITAAYNSQPPYYPHDPRPLAAVLDVLATVLPENES